MSTLLIKELFNGVVLEQTFRISSPVNVAVIRPYIYKNGTIATGSLQLRVKHGVTVLATKTIGFADINSGITGTYAHGYIKFEFDSLPLQVAEGNDTEEYTLELSMINHTTDTNNFLAWAKDWDDSKYATYGSGANSFDQPNGFEIFEYRS